MLTKLRSHRPSHAVVVAYLALFVALGGSSYAAVSISGKNVKNSSLTSSDVKNNSLTGADIKNLKSGDVSDHSLLARDFKAGELPTGPPGPTGAKGDKGATGDRGPSDTYAATTFDPLSLPAGNYLIYAQDEFQSGGTNPVAGSLDCTLHVGGNDLDAAAQSYPANGFATCSVVGQVHLAAPSTVEIGGSASFGEGFYRNPRVEAIRVAALH